MTDGNKPICKYYPHKPCPRGTKCSFMHVQAQTGVTSTSLSRSTSGTLRQAPSKKANKDGNNAPDNCTFYLKGSCKYGDACRYTHPSSQAPSGSSASLNPPTITQDERRPCRYWKSGFCKDGNACAFRHDCAANHKVSQSNTEGKSSALFEGTNHGDDDEIPEAIDVKPTSSSTPRSPSPIEPSGHNPDGLETQSPDDQTMKSADDEKLDHGDAADNKGAGRDSEAVIAEDDRHFQRKDTSGLSCVPEVPPDNEGTHTMTWAEEMEQEVFQFPTASAVDDGTPILPNREELPDSIQSVQWEQLEPVLDVPATQDANRYDRTHALPAPPAHFKEPHWTEYADPHANPLTPFCKFFARDTCNQEQNCRFRHCLTTHDHFLLFLDPRPPLWSRISMEQQQANSNATPIHSHPRSDLVSAFGNCKFYPLGRCRNGDACPYAHVMSDDITQHEPEPRPFRNENEDDRDEEHQGTYGDGWANGAETIDWDDTGGEASGPPRDGQQQGWTTPPKDGAWGANGGREHASYRGGVNRGYCRQHARGQCRRGDFCRFRHDDPSSPQVDAPVEESAQYPSANETWDIPWDTQSQTSFIRSLGGVAYSDAGWRTPNDERARSVVTRRSCSTQHSGVDSGRSTPVSKTSRFDQASVGGWSNTLDDLNKQDEYDKPIKIRKPCKLFGQGYCSKGDRCIYLHIDQPNRTRADDEEQEESSGWPEVGEDTSQDWSVPLELEYIRREFRHCKVFYGPGCTVERVVTEHESPVVNVHGMSRDTARQDVVDLVSSSGYALNISLLEMKNDITARVEFLNATEASDAARKLSSEHPLFSVVRGEIPLMSADNSHTPHPQTTKLRLTWPAPSAQAWCHYPTISAAKAEEARLSGLILAHREVKAVFHSPRKGQTHSFAVQLTNLPVATTREEVERMCIGTTLVVMDKRAYIESPVDQIVALVHSFNPLASFDIIPPTETDTKHSATFLFATSFEAENAVRSLNAENPEFLGNARLWATLVHYTKLAIPSREFWSIQNGLLDLQKQHPNDCRIDYSELNFETLIFVHAQAVSIEAYNITVQKVQELVKGQILSHEGKPLWDHYFDLPTSGKAIEHLNANDDTSYFITCDPGSQTISVIGDSAGKERANAVVLRLLDKVRSQQSIIPVTPWIMHPLLHGGLQKLWDEFGEVKVTLDVSALQLIVRGGSEVMAKVQESLRHSQPDISDSDNPICQICLHVAKDPIGLACDHSFCTACLRQGIRNCIGGQFRSLTCFAVQEGSGTRCRQTIPHDTPHSLLPTAEENLLLESSFLMEVRKGWDGLAFCPARNCDAVYRKNQRDSTFFCSRCQSALCPFCINWAHERSHCGI